MTLLEEQAPAAVTGGRYAMAGFRYQILVTLLAIVQQFVREDSGDSIELLSQIEMEGASDLVAIKNGAIENGLVEVVQIKRTQTSSSIRRALDDLWDKYRRASYDTELQSHLHFKIQAAESRVKDVQAAVRGWSEKHGGDRQIADFIKQLGDPEIIADPRGDIFTLMLNSLRDTNPGRRVQRWLGLLLDASEEGGFDAGIEAIRNDLRSLRDNRESSPIPREMVLFGPADIPPVTLQRGGFLTGERPRLDDLRDGCFAERPTAFAKIERDFSKWLEDRRADEEDQLNKRTKLPVFWISGRSGAGKSVLLLQLLSRLHADKTVRVLWLANQTRHLPVAVDWVRTAMDSDNGKEPQIPWAIGIDDPYRVGAQALGPEYWQDAIGKLRDLLETGQQSMLPLVICCGPDEQAEMLEHEHGEDLDLFTSRVENEAEADYEELRNWFSARTGDTPPPVTERNLLLVQLFFEWRHRGESLRHFADRFRTRLKGMDQGRQVSGDRTMEGLVRRALTINRLYGGYPFPAISGRLDPEQLDSLDALLDEEHLQTRVKGQSEDLWIAHPHLSNVIYETWFPAVKRRARTGHLLDVIADCEEYGPTVAARMTALLAIVRTVQDKTGGLSERLDQEVARDALVEAYRRVGDSGLSLIGLAYWIEITAAMPAVDWSPDPVAIAVKRMQDISQDPKPSPGLRGLCYRLLRYAPTAPGVAGAIIELIDRLLSWHEAVPIARAALTQLADPELDEAAYRWASQLAATGESEFTRAGALLSAAMDRPLPDARLVMLAASLLESAPARRDWAGIAVSLLRREQEGHLPSIVSWISRHLGQTAATGPLLELLRTDVPAAALPDIVQLSAQWVRHKPMASASWSFIMGALLQRLSEDLPQPEAGAEAAEHQGPDEVAALRAETRELAARWLREMPGDHPGWAHLFEALWTSDGGGADLENTGLDWLRDNPQHRGWAHLWEFLWQLEPGRPELVDLGVPWLAEQADHPAWGHVWDALHGVGESSDWLGQVGRAWLTTHFGYDYWSQVWRALWDAYPGDNDLADAAFAVFRENPDDPFLGTVFTALWNSRVRLAELGEFGMDLLGNHPDSKSWFFVWEKLAKSRDHSDMIRESVLGWLQENFENNKWSDPWEWLWKAGEFRDLLFDLALSWLSSQPGQTTWGYVWKNLWEAPSRREEAARVAIEWLRSAPHGHGAWTHVWTQLWASGNYRGGLTEIGLCWLKSNFEHSGWTRPWEALWKTGNARERLTALGVSWLKKRPDDPTWGLPWHGIWDEGGNRARLRNIALRWLPDHLSHLSWPWVWRKMWDFRGPPGYHGELAMLGLSWMRDNPESDSLTHVFEAIWDSKRIAPELTEFGLSWLRDYPNRKKWSYVWKKLWRTGAHKDELIRYGHAWVQRNPRDPERKRVQGMLVSAPSPATSPLTGRLAIGTFIAEPLSSLGAGSSRRRDSVEDAAFTQIQLIADAVRNPADPAPEGSLHFHGPSLPACELRWWTPLLDSCSALAIRAASPATTPDTRRALCDFLQKYDAAGLAASINNSPWKYVRLILDGEQLKTQGSPAGNAKRSPCGLLPLPEGALIAVVDAQGDKKFDALFYDPARQFAVPTPYEAVTATPIGEARDDGWLSRFLAVLDERGPAPWFPEAADRFAELAGLTATEARLIITSLPNLRWKEGSSLPREVRKMLGLNQEHVDAAHDQLARVNSAALRKTVASLLPTSTELLWTDGPDVASAARAWNHLVGHRMAVPETLAVEAKHAVRTPLPSGDAMHAALDPAASWLLNRDMTWRIDRREAVPVKNNGGFTADALTGTIAMLAWLAHRLPAGDQSRAKLPAALSAIRARLANSELMLSFNTGVSLATIRDALGPPTYTGAGFEGYGAIIVPTRDPNPVPALRPALLDAATSDHALSALRPGGQAPFPVETALRLAYAPGFEAALADPGDPLAGERDADGTWAPQDPSRSVPSLVGDVAAEYELTPDGAALYLMLLAMPDPTDQNIARWTDWNAGRLAAARDELTSTDLVAQASRPRAGRSLFLPGGWVQLESPHRPLEQWKLPLLDGLVVGNTPAFYVVVPTVPAASIYQRSWQRVKEDKGPGFVSFDY